MALSTRILTEACLMLQFVLLCSSPRVSTEMASSVCCPMISGVFSCLVIRVASLNLWSVSFVLYNTHPPARPSTKRRIASSLWRKPGNGIDDVVDSAQDIVGNLYGLIDVAHGAIIVDCRMSFECCVPQDSLF